MIKLIKKLFFTKSPKKIAREQFLAVKLTNHHVCIDCGANVGEYTEYMARNGSKVYAFEPNPYAFEILEKKFAGRDNVHCLQKGVLDKEGSMRLYLHNLSEQDQVRYSKSSSLLGFKENVSEDSYVEVEVIDLCAFIERIDGRIRLLKMDVEGVEGRILKKMLETGLSERIDHIFVETHDHKIPRLKAETDEVRALIREKNQTHINLDWR